MKNSSLLELFISNTTIIHSRLFSIWMRWNKNNTNLAPSSPLDFWRPCQTSLTSLSVVLFLNIETHPVHLYPSLCLPLSDRYDVQSVFRRVIREAALWPARSCYCRSADYNNVSRCNTPRVKWCVIFFFLIAPLVFNLFDCFVIRHQCI